MQVGNPSDYPTKVKHQNLHINICCFISDCRSVVNFNYVSSPKNGLSLCHISKGFNNFGRFRIKVLKWSKFLKLQAFQHHQVTDKPDYWQFEKKIQNSSCRQLSSLFKDNNFCHAFYFMVSVFITFLKYMYESNKL